MISVIIEPPASFAARQMTPRPLASVISARDVTKTPTRITGPSPNDDYWTNLIFRALRDNGDEPMRFTSVVNSTVRQWRFEARCDRERKKIELFKLVGKLIRMGRLERVGRKHVNIPLNDEKHRAYLAKFAAPLNFSKPQL